jgi:hypothetical protein
MAATDHLSGAQFMPIEKVGQMRSGNFPGMTVEEEYQARMRGEAPQRQNDDARARHHGFRDASDYQAAITGSIRTRGMVNAPEFRHDQVWNDDREDYDRTGTQTMTTGHHRYTAARNLGWTHLPVKEQGPYGSDNRPVPGWKEVV